MRFAKCARPLVLTHAAAELDLRRMTKPNKPALLSAHSFPGANPSGNSAAGPQISPTSMTGFLHPDHARKAQAAMATGADQENQPPVARTDDAMEF
jgi:hypothetical protein